MTKTADSIRTSKIKDIKRLIKNKITTKLGENYLEDYIFNNMDIADRTWLEDKQTKQNDLIITLTSITDENNLYAWHTYKEISKIDFSS